MTPNLEVIRNLRQQITERPEDYSLRLVYADALEESGIEVNIQRARKLRERSWFRTWPAMVDGLGRISFAGRGGIFAINTYQDAVENPLLEIVRCTMQFWLNHGSFLVSRYPIQRVRITDKRAAENTPGQFLWIKNLSEGNDANHSYKIPSSIFVHMESSNWFKSFAKVNYIFKVRRDARLALSDACIQWAKEQ